MYTAGGIFYKSFDFERDRRYWSFSPTKLNLLGLKFDEDVTDLLVQAHWSLVILEGMVEYIPNIESFFNAPHVIVNTQEYNPPPLGEIEGLLQGLYRGVQNFGNYIRWIKIFYSV